MIVCAILVFLHGIGEKQNVEHFKIGDTIKKTIDHAFVLGTALAAAVILAPAAVAWDPYEPAIYPDNSIHLAADIVNLTPTVVDPRPAPVAVVSAEPVVTTPFVTVPAEPVVTTPFVTVPAEVPVTVETTLPVTVPVATTMPATVIVTDAETVTVPEYSYVFYEGEYIPYYEGWLYYRDIWSWIGTEPRPPFPPRWTPPPRRPTPDHRRIIVRTEPPRRDDRNTVRTEPPRRDDRTLGQLVEFPRSESTTAAVTREPAPRVVRETTPAKTTRETAPAVVRSGTTTTNATRETAPAKAPREMTSVVRETTPAKAAPAKATRETAPAVRRETAPAKTTRETAPAVRSNLAPTVREAPRRETARPGAVRPEQKNAPRGDAPKKRGR